MTINYDLLLLWYYVYLLEMAWITLQCTLFCLSVQSDKHSAGDRLYILWPLTPAHCHGWGGGYLSPGAYLTPPSPKPSHTTSCSEQSALRLNQSKCFSVTPRTELRLFFFWPLSREADISTELHGQSGLQEAAAADPSQLVCTIMYSPSPLCLTTPFLYSNGETPVGVWIWHLYKCTSLKKKMKPWHIWNKCLNCVVIFDHKQTPTLPFISEGAALSLMWLCT